MDLLTAIYNTSRLLESKSTVNFLDEREKLGDEKQETHQGASSIFIVSESPFQPSAELMRLDTMLMGKQECDQGNRSGMAGLHWSEEDLI